MKISELFKDMLKGIKNSIRRFPETICISTACVILLIYMSEMGYRTDEGIGETLTKLTMVLALGIPLSLCIKLYFERVRDYKKILLYGVYVGGAVLLILYYFVFLKDFEMVSITRYIGCNVILYLVFLFISYIPKKENFELYVIRVLTRFFTTILYSIILYLGITVIFFTIDKLLGINIKGEIYYYNWLIVSGVFAPSFFLSGIPENNEELALKDYSKLVKVLVLYIIIPLISVYTIILYIYFGKIIITRQWPEGLVSHLVLWYSVISAAVLFLISPLLDEVTWIRRYVKVFPKAILPLIIMMFFSIGIRINTYGVTENRYYVVALGIWVLFTMIYFSFSNKRRNIILPITLAVITFVSVFGPFSSYSISKYSQNKRLEKILIRNNMIENKKAIKAESEVSERDTREISNILNYFDNNHSLRDVKVLPEDFKIRDMEKVLGLKYHDEYHNNNNQYFYFNVFEGDHVMDIRGYDFLFDSRNQRFDGSKNSPISIRFEYETNVLRISENGEEVYKKDLGDFAKTLIEEYGLNHRGQNIDYNKMAFVDENDKIKVKIQFFHIGGYKDPTTGKIESSGFEFNVLVKVK